MASVKSLGNKSHPDGTFMERGYKISKDCLELTKDVTWAALQNMWKGAKWLVYNGKEIGKETVIVAAQIVTTGILWHVAVESTDALGSGILGQVASGGVVVIMTTIVTGAAKAARIGTTYLIGESKFNTNKEENLSALAGMYSAVLLPILKQEPNHWLPELVGSASTAHFIHDYVSPHYPAMSDNWEGTLKNVTLFSGWITPVLKYAGKKFEESGARSLANEWLSWGFKAVKDYCF